MRTIRNTGLWVAAAVAFALWAPPAAAENVQPAIARLQQAARGAGTNCYVRRLPNGQQRLYLNPSSSRSLRAIQQATGRGSNVLQICHINGADFGRPGHMHTLAMFDGVWPHFQTPDGFRSWRINDWGPMRASNNRLYSAFIQLTESEGQRLRDLFATANREQGRAGTIPSAWARGNCASIWTNLPVGDRGETLGQICNIGTNGSPHGLQQALETRANDRVFAIGVYGPQLRDFGRNPEANVVQFTP